MTLQKVRLTPAEHEVARSIVRGEPASEAAAKMGIPQSRYRAMMLQVQRKTGARSHHELVSLLTGVVRDG